MTNATFPNHVIRQATPQDASELARFFTELGHRTTAEEVAARWSPWTEAGNFAYVAVNADGTLSGLVTLNQMIVLHRPKPVGRITALIVDASRRGKGAGRALVAAAEQTLARNGCGMLEITSHTRLAAAHTFYEHLGYTRTSIRLAKELPPASSCSRHAPS